MIKEWREIATNKIEDADVCIMGIGFDGAASVGKGAALGPEQIRKCSEVQPPANAAGDFFRELRVYDDGDIEFILDWEAYYAEVEKRACELLQTGKFCIFLGGDHSVSIPLSKALRKAYPDQKIGIIHFDSHPDLCDEYEGSKWSHACPLRRMLEDVIETKDLAQVGIRSYEYEEVEFFAEHPELLVIRAQDIFRDGYEKYTKVLIDKFKDYDFIYITLDIDVLDPAFAPGTGTPEAGGLSSRELMVIINELMSHLPVHAMDLVEVSPTLDTTNQITSWVASKIIYEVFADIAKRNH
ncbi:MAG: agmatinase [Bacillota bacterium]|nr:agmatinase [Bacillota bacterium]